MKSFRPRLEPYRTRKLVLALVGLWLVPALCPAQPAATSRPAATSAPAADANLVLNETGYFRSYYEFGLWRIAVALVAWVALLVLHPLVIGVQAFPG